MNQQTARLLINRLRRLQDTTHKGKMFILPEGAVSRLDHVERRLVEAIRRDESGELIRDGYPSGQVGSGGQDSGSSTESAALAGFKLDNPAHVEQSSGVWQDSHDPHRELTRKATTHLENAVESVSLLLGVLDEIDRRANVTPHSNPGGSCLVCDRHVEGTADDRLRRGMCHADYVAWVRAERPDITEFRRSRTEAA